jgi:ppGpp synthetase/RelA/SpoT-type nucleotidyltranferase
MEMSVIQRLSNAIRTQRVERTFGIEALCRVLEGYLPDKQVGEVRRAAEFATSVHEGQRRTSGEPYVYHPLAVARTLAEMRLDHTTLMAAILHDVIEDTGVSKESLALEFGADVAELVDGVSKVTRIEGRTRDEMQAQSFRKLLLAMTKDLRVILVKLADRLHNMRTLGAVTTDKRRRIARETLEIYAPIAQRLGIYFIRTELEDLAFAALYPKRYSVLQQSVSAQLGDTKRVIREVEQKLSTTLREEGIGATVVGRQKNIYGIYQKMLRKKLKLLKVMDLLGFRVIVSKVDDCYRALGVVHHVYKPVPNEFDDYIANPKSNGYQSLHTACIGPEGHKIEVQIRTRDMHHVAESGIAAHWQYKQGARDGSSAPQARAGRARVGRRAVRRFRLGEPDGLHRERQSRSVPRRGLRVHAQGRHSPPAEGLDAGRLRLCRAFRARRSLRRRAPRRPARAAAQRAAQRPDGADHHCAPCAPERGVAELRQDRQGAGGDPQLPAPAARGRGGAPRPAAARDRAARAVGAGERPQGRGAAGAGARRIQAR